jgi:hypothetical protein
MNFLTVTTFSLIVILIILRALIVVESTTSINSPTGEKEATDKAC